MGMDKETQWRVLLVSSFVFYGIAAPLFSRYVSSSGIFGILYAIPLSVATWRWGRRAGLAAALAGVVLNEVVWIWLHGLNDLVAPSRLPEIVSGIFLEAAAFILFALAIIKMKDLRIRYDRSEELRKLSESNYLGLIELAPEGAAVVQDMRVVYCNDHLLSLFGYSRNEMLGRPFHLMLHEEERERAVQLYVRRLEGESGNAGAVRYVRKDGETRWMNYVGTRIQWDGSHAALYLVSDISEKMALEQQYRQTQKLEAVGRLAGGIAHDFNNILQVILGSCESLAGHAHDPKAVLADTAVVKEAASTATSLTRQLLAFSRTQGGTPRTIDVGEVLQRSEKMLEFALGADIALTVILGEDPATVRADEGRIQQVIMNLAVNARDAMPDGGSLTIRVARESVPAGVRCQADVPFGAACVTLSVSDTGCGMKAGTLERVFEPFFTTKETGKGTGLGLWIVHSIVTQAGGTISVDSAPGTGTTFAVRLPLVEGEVVPARHGLEPQPLGGTGRILLVDDQDDVRRLVKLMLERRGYTVTACPDASAALEACREPGASFHLLLTDLTMPGMRGRELAGHVTRLHPEMQVVFMTGHDERTAESPHDTDHHATLLKPFHSEELLSLVQGVLARGRRAEQRDEPPKSRLA
jgi:two-component system cell cycle sensor histidine kinase/response regulator CckA